MVGVGLVVMDRRYVISLVVIALLIILFVISIVFSPKEVVDDTPGETCEERCNGVESCLTQCADTRANLATLNNDASGCDQILDPVRAESCRRDVNLKEALNKQDGSGCLDEQCRNDVLLSRAIEENDKSLCEQITNEVMKANCLDLLNEL